MVLSVATGIFPPEELPLTNKGLEKRGWFRKLLTHASVPENLLVGLLEAATCTFLVTPLAGDGVGRFNCADD